MYTSPYEVHQHCRGGKFAHCACGRQSLNRTTALALVLLLIASTDDAVAQQESGAPQPPTPGYIDAEDGWFDLSDFLDTAYGFVPMVAPITEPAVGYGAAGSLLFIDRDKTQQAHNRRPDIAAIGGLGTENGTRGLFAAHLGNWLDGRLRTQIAVADTDINLAFFGLGSGQLPGQDGVEYNIDARVGMVGASYRIGDSPLWAGLRYVSASTTVALNDDRPSPPGVPDLDLGLDLGALTPSLTVDTRDNFFTPTSGSYLDLSMSFYRDAVGSDRDFDKFVLTGMHYSPLTADLYLGARGSIETSSDNTPFYLRPAISLRGVQALRYQGEEAAEVEAELRWQLHPRFSLVGFGGAGVARMDNRFADSKEKVYAGGGGFRYLLARKHGLHMGLDVATGPDGPIWYVVFGSAWLRP